MGKAADWLREERRKVLGDWASVCLDCGAAQRWFDGFEVELPERCSACGGPTLHRCPGCSAPFSSVFATQCEQCGGELRSATLFGLRIRRE
jgi:hypothetical protein